MPAWQSYLQDRQEQSLAELLDLLRIPSISALPEHAGDVQDAAAWVAERLRAAGLEHVEVMPTGGHPVVYGDWLHADGRPTILIYGHFDVQPIDPLALWTDPPFEPALHDGRVYARGASDMKGNLLTTILAAEAWLQAEGKLPVNVKFLLEGQEEIGSPQLPDFVRGHRDLLACDLAVSADGGQYSEDQPALLIGLRGGCGLQIDVRGPAADLHSGLYGGIVHNPNHALVRILDSMRSPDGKVLVDGFYEDVVPLSDEDRARIAAVPFDEAEHKRSLDVDAFFGEPGYTPIERNWARPTLEIVGMWGGFQGEGVKTVLPSEAHAKITCRLVPNQDPRRIVELIGKHVERVTPPGVRVRTTPLGFVAWPYLIPADHPGNQVAGKVLREVYGREPYFMRLGGSVPVCETILTELGAYTVGFGFGLEDENLHSPNEFWRLRSFETGQRAWGMLLGALAERQSY
jgi:acetylornithine deacetylase/succinyl-diaminopimelate desuccinylase-like protein